MVKEYKEWIDKASDHFAIGDRALVLLGDSAKILRGTNLKVDSVITDPPYDFDSEGGPSLFNREYKSAFNDMRERGLSDGFDHEILKSAALADSMIVFMHNDQLFDILETLTQQKFPPIGYHYDDVRDTAETALYDRFVLCQWHKENPMPVANKHYIPDTEIYIHCWRKPFFPQGELSDKGRWISAPVGKSKYDHPTVKPQKIMRKCVTNGSERGGVILDPFCGSGSTGVAALAMGRKFIGIEQDKEFFKIACDRVSIASGDRIPDEGNQMGLF